MPFDRDHFNVDDHDSVRRVPIWIADTTASGNVRTTKVLTQTGTVSRFEFLSALRDESIARDWLTRQLLASADSAIRWEMPAYSEKLTGNPAEFTVIPCASLERPSDFTSFVGQFTDRSDTVRAFANLRGDATMIVPRRLRSGDHFAHLLGFLRTATAIQIDSLWQLVAAIALDRAADRTVWLSTAGMGVPWLHVRVDDRPKYYAHAPYRDPAM